MFDGFAPRPTATARWELDPLDPINRGVRAFLPLTDGAGGRALDISPYRRNGTLTNFSHAAGSGWGVGKLGRTLAFDGTDDFVENTNYSTTNNQPVSAFAWVMPSAFTNFAGIATNLIEGTFLGWVLYIHGDQTVGTYLDAHRRSTNTIPANAWSHIGFTYNGNIVTLYINGILQRSDAAATYSGNTSFRIGNFYTTVNVGASRFAGAANNVRVYNRAISQNEVARLYRDPWAGAIDPAARLVVAMRSPALAPITGTLAATLSAPTLAASGALAIAGVAAFTLAAPTLSATGALAISASASITLAAPALTATGTLALTGAAAITLSAPTLAATGTLPIVGTAAITLAGVTLVASGRANPLGVAPAERTLTWPYTVRSVRWNYEARTATWADTDRTVTWRH